MESPGRKFWITLLGMGLSTLLPLVSRSPDVGTAISAIGAMVLAFCGANAAVSWGYAKADSTERKLTGSSEIEARRDNVSGWEPTP